MSLRLTGPCDSPSCGASVSLYTCWGSFNACLPARQEIGGSPQQAQAELFRLANESWSR